MNTHQELIEEKVNEFKELGVGYKDSIEPILDVLPNIDHPELGTYSFEKWLTQTLQDTVDTVLEGERERVKELLQDNIWPGELNEHTNRVLNNVKEALTPLNKE